MMDLKIFTEQFREIFSILHNTDLDALVDNGIIMDRTGTNWTRFNSDLTTFILKLPEDRLGRLAALVAGQLHD